jgi:pimeloyl-ACP methyl ester carboxylesterase
MTAPRKPPVVLIHGLWLNRDSWQTWVERYQAAGHEVLAPGWPGMDASVAELNRDLSPMNDVGVGEVVDSYEKILDTLDQEPVLMGHSFGGAVVQVLLSRGRGAAGVAIHPAPIKGVLRLPVAALRSASPVLRNPANRHKTVALTPEQWHYSFCNTLSRDESDELYRRFAVPTPGRPLFQAATANFDPHAATKVDYRKPDRAPLLLIGSDKTDHTVPGSIVRETKAHYHSGLVELKEYPGRPHFTGGTPGWEAVADYALEWATRVAPAHPAPRSAVPKPRPAEEPAPKDEPTPTA